MATKLEKTANIALILACGVFSTVYGMDLYHRLRPAGPPPPYKAGEIIKDTPELGLSHAHMTMVLVTRSNCHFCAASMPFYQRMQDATKRAGVRLVGATMEEPKANESYLTSNQVYADAIVSTGKNQIRASATPTLILVRNDGRVVNSWVGQLQESQENEVLKTIKGDL